jgi:hypothetical protein
VPAPAGSGWQPPGMAAMPPPPPPGNHSRVRCAAPVARCLLCFCRWWARMRHGGWGARVVARPACQLALGRSTSAEPPPRRCLAAAPPTPPHRHHR